MNAPLGLVAFLGLLLVASAVAAVSMQHSQRSLFVELQLLERQRDLMQVEWENLQLEQSVWSTHDRIIEVATQRLALKSPAAESIVLVLR